jgi:NADH-quinone oxidoreductase subunit C
MSTQNPAQALEARFPGLFSAPVVFRGETTLSFADPEKLTEICAFAKEELGFNYLVDITSIDEYGEDPRFVLVYHLYGFAHRQYLRIKTAVGEAKGEVPSVTGIWATADWHEREIYDMMGVRFRGHPDLRRILMWEGYPFYPLRKDFPLAGRVTDLPEVAFSQPAPLAGGPFVTVAGGKTAVAREPRVRHPESESVETNARVERRQDVAGTQGHAAGPGPIKSQK